MAVSVVIELLDSNDAVLLETQAGHWDAAAVRRALKDVTWVDVSQVAGFSDDTTDLDAQTALGLHESFRARYLRSIALYEELVGSYRSKGEIEHADQHAKVGEDEKAQLAALDEIVRRARVCHQLSQTTAPAR